MGPHSNILCKNNAGNSSWEEELKIKLDDTAKWATNIMMVPALKRAATKYHEEAAKHKEKAEKEHHAAKRKLYAAKAGGQWAICRDMSSRMAAPLIAVKRTEKGPTGQPAGTVTTSPKEIDGIIRQAYGKIYKGNTDDVHGKTDLYMRKYEKYIYQARQARIEKLTGNDLKLTAQCTKESAAGLDQWTPGDLKMISDKAYEKLAAMLNMILAGAKWPTHLERARAAFLSKDPRDTLNPLAYRILLMLPAVYRMWSKTRLRHLQPWVASWAVPEMFAGVEGKGAEDATYSAAILVEWCRLTGMEFTGGSADIFKCFDQVMRPLVQRLLETAGMPKEVVETYVKYLENLSVHNTVAGGIGEAYRRPTSIPQGDPMSMMVIALLLRAWIMQMRSLAMKPRILADDLQIISTGTRHLDHFQYAYSITHEHLDDMGAKIAPQKCFTFSSDTVSREWLRRHRWRRLGRTVLVVNGCRDLGAHFNVSADKKVGTTLTERMRQATKSTERLDMFNAPYDKKEAIIRTKMLPKGLYGCELAPVNEAAMRAFRTATAACLTFSTAQKATDLTFAAATRGTDVDPDVNVVCKRIKALRRSMAKDEEIKAMAHEIMEKYREMHEPGCYTTADELKEKPLAGAPCTPERARLKKQCRPQGPIGLLLESIHLQAATIDRDFNIHQWNQPAIQLTKAPFQQIGAMAIQMCTRNRTRSAANKREMTKGLAEIDKEATRAETKKMDPQDRIILDLTRTGAMWTRTAAYWAGQVDDRMCQLCHQADETSDHFWKCKALKDARKEVDEDLAKFNADAILALVRHGVAPAMAADTTKTFWGYTGSLHMDAKQKELCGCDVNSNNRDITEEVNEMRDLIGLTAREVVQGHIAAQVESGAIPMPERVNGTPPEQPNVYSDGSVHNPASTHWKVGGIGIFWPRRNEEELPLTDAETKFMQKEVTPSGMRMWNCFSNLMNSSTRCEIGAALIAMLPNKAVNIGSDSLATVRKGNATIEHQKQRSYTRLYDEEGRMMLGGKTSHLHRESPWKRTWQLSKDGDVWEQFHNIVAAKSPHAVRLTKVKGHATEQMVEMGTLKRKTRKVTRRRMVQLRKDQRNHSGRYTCSRRCTKRGTRSTRSSWCGSTSSSLA